MSQKFLIGFLLVSLGILIGYAIWYPIFDFGGTGEEAGENNGPETGISELQFAAVVENSPEGRPQSGLSLADFVFETVTEGGITRFLAMFGSREAERLGPIRSARPYFVDWALGFDAPLVHAGASAEAAGKISRLGAVLKDADEFFNGRYFFRDSAKPAPFNLFTTSESMAALIESQNWDEAASGFGWSTKADTPLTEAAVKDIFINFSHSAFAARYEYDASTNTYKRFLGGEAQVDALTGEQIVAKNVVVLETTSSVIDPELLTIDLKTLGSGRARIFRDGQVLFARWKKDSPQGKLQLLDADDSLIALNQGPTWFAVVDQFGRVSWE